MLERGSRGAGEGDRGAALVEGGEEFLAHGWVEHGGGGDEQDDRADDEEGSGEGGAEEGCFGEGFEGSDERAVAVGFAFFWFQEERAKDGDDRE